MALASLVRVQWTTAPPHGHLVWMAGGSLADELRAKGAVVREHRAPSESEGRNVLRTSPPKPSQKTRAVTLQWPRAGFSGNHCRLVFNDHPFQRCPPPSQLESTRRPHKQGHVSRIRRVVRLGTSRRPGGQSRTHAGPRPAFTGLKYLGRRCLFHRNVASKLPHL